MEIPKPYREQRPWGAFVEFTRNAPSTIKILTVERGQAFSLQHHSSRDEFWHIISGEGTVTVGSEKTLARAGGEYFIPRGTDHRLEAGSQALSVLEISFGDFDEGDIVRLEDRYGRTATKGP